MITGSAPDKRAYQRLLIDQANAEMGRQRISRRQLMRLTGIPDATMNRIFTCERDMNVAQWGCDRDSARVRPRRAGTQGAQHQRYTPTE